MEAIKSLWINARSGFQAGCFSQLPLMDFGGIGLTALGAWQAGHIKYNRIKTIYRSLYFIYAKKVCGQDFVLFVNQ